MRMTEKEARDTMKACGWSFLLRERRGRREYIYAARRIQGRRQEKYIGSLAALASLTAQQLKDILECA
jgi:hypothetical protein